MLKDARGLSVSTSSAFALEQYESALDQFQRYSGDPIATIDAALAADDEFIVGHLFRACALYTASERRYLPDARAAVERAEMLAARATDHERGLTDAVRQLVDGHWHAAARGLDAVLRDFPRDVLAIQTGHLMDFYRGDALNLRNRISRVLPAWSPALPGYSYLLGMHAFGLEECNQYPEAEATARRALAIEPRDGWAVHAVTHVMEMQGRIDEGVDWLGSREADWAAPDNLFAPHNWWHLALFYIDRGEHAAALDLFDRKLAGPQADMILVLIDCTALLWRLLLEGVEVGDRFVAVAQRWEDKLDIEQGFYAFNDVHAMMSFAATGRRPAIERLLADMRRTALQAGGSNQEMTREIGLPLAEGMLAFAEGRYAQAIEHIEPVRDVANRFGGSHAQRDVLTLTLIEAATRSGDRSRARHLLAERLVHKPTAWSARLATRAGLTTAGFG
ncbi:MAG: tetratricopeptide repeat protein [Candidatus Accumulibacter sp. UW26]|jgi:tetratricopeptide (TPR) repeat protein